MKKLINLRVLRDEKQELFVSGDDRQISWASQIWMCIAGVAEGQQAANLLKRAKQADDICSMVTPYLFHHYVQALMECGEQEQAISEIKRYCHAWSCTPSYLLRKIY